MHIIDSALSNYGEVLCILQFHKTLSHVTRVQVWPWSGTITASWARSLGLLRRPSKTLASQTSHVRSALPWPLPAVVVAPVRQRRRVVEPLPGGVCACGEDGLFMAPAAKRTWGRRCVLLQHQSVQWG
jgi:hypothetical protein